MYEDFKGEIIVDTKDQYPNLENYAEKFEGVDLELYNLKSIEFLYAGESFSNGKFILQEKANSENIVEVDFKPMSTVFKDLIKTAKIKIENE